MEGSATLVEAMGKLGATNLTSLKNELTKRGLQHPAREVRDSEKARRKQRSSTRSDNSGAQNADEKWFHDDEGGYYVFLFGTRPKVVPEEKWQRVCWLYPQAGEGRTAAQIATELDIPTPDLRVMLRLYALDKHGAPYTHEQLRKGDPEELAEESLEAIRKKFHVARQNREKAQTRRDLMAAQEELYQRKKTLSDLEAAAGRVVAATGPPKPVEPVRARLGGSEPGSFRALAPITDVHGGKFAWSRETWGGNYDTKIAARTIEAHGEAVADFVGSLPGRCTDLYSLDLGDFFNGLDLQTEAGTPQEQDGRAFKVWETMLAAEIEKIEALREVSDTLHIRRVRGNHDGIFAQFFFSTLEQRYAGVEDVVCEAHPRYQDAFRIDRALYVLDHGKGLPQNLNTPAAKTAAQRVARNVGGDDFYAARFVYFFCGHLHEESRATEDNMRMYRLPAACDQADYEVAGRYSTEPGARIWTLDALGRPDLEKPVYFREIVGAA